MEIFFYIIIFIMGTLFGSFYSLAIHRIPKKQDIIHTHSYCPNCNKKLGILDLFPVLSYILLGGKCRQCKSKISPRYLILEVCTGLIFVLIAYFSNLNLETISVIKISEAFIFSLYLTYLMLIIGIAKNTTKIEKSVNIYGIIISILYMLYLCLFNIENIYKYGIYLIVFIIILILDARYMKKHASSSDILSILTMLWIITIFTGKYIAIYSVVLTLLIVGIYNLIYQIKNRKKDNNKIKENSKDIEVNYKEKINIPMYFGITNIILIVGVFVFMYVV